MKLRLPPTSLIILIFGLALIVGKTWFSPGFRHNAGRRIIAIILNSSRVLNPGFPEE